MCLLTTSIPRPEMALGAEERPIAAGILLGAACPTSVAENLSVTSRRHTLLLLLPHRISRRRLSRPNLAR